MNIERTTKTALEEDIFVPKYRSARSTLEEQLIKNPWILNAEACKRSFFVFVQEFWGCVCPETPLWNWHIAYLCQEFQIIAERVFKRQDKEYDLIVNIPPGTTKSTVCTIMFPAWCWTVDPTLRFITASYSKDLSLEHSDKSREILKSDKYLKYFPEVKLKLTKDIKSNYENTKLGTRFTTSVGGTSTGMHAHIIIVDDPLNPKQAASDLERASANTWLDNTLSTRKVEKSLTPLILIMQRLHVDDCSAHTLEKGTRVKHICLPGTLDGYNTPMPSELSKYYVDNLLDPVRLSRSVLDEMRKDMGELNYMSQIDQTPMLKEGAMFKIEKFNIVGAFNEKDIVASYRYWDKAGTDGGGAYTAGVKIHKMRNGRFLISDLKRGQWSAPTREMHIKQTAELDGRKVKIGIEQEPGSGGKESAESSVKMLAGFVVKVDKVTGDKATRAEPYSVQVDASNVDILKADWNPEFLKEHETFPVGKYKDIVDAASGAFNAIAGGNLKAGTWGKR